MFQITEPKYLILLLLTPLFYLAGCSATNAVPELSSNALTQQVTALGKSIDALDDSIDRDEAQRAARIAIEYPLELAQQYRISGSALFHNLMVNIGLRERGLCIDWTADLKARLEQEQFRSLDLHWAIANYETPFRLEHSTVVISAVGATLEQGIVLDPWRNTGRLFWSATLADDEYGWKPRAEIHALKRIHIEEINNRDASR